MCSINRNTLRYVYNTDIAFSSQADLHIEDSVHYRAAAIALACKFLSLPFRAAIKRHDLGRWMSVARRASFPCSSSRS